MAKRANPFAEDFIKQRKVYVSLKQFNNNADRLQKVYEKTLELLYNGAKKGGNMEVPANSDEKSSRKDKLKQLCINKDGSISHSTVAVMDKSPPPVRQCKCNSQAVESQCAYCETALCSKCQHCCSHCSKMYCSRCFLTGNDGSEVCVSCYV